MPAHTPYQRQTFLLRYLEARRGHPVPFETLRAAVEAKGFMADFGKPYSLRNWQRDKQQLEEKFGLSIGTRRGAGYSLAADSPAPDPTALRLADALELHDFLQLPAALGPFVQPEPRRPLGLEHLRPLLQAAQAGEVVEFDYLKHWEDGPQRRTVGPLLLREFRGRWYMLGCMAGSGRVACFGLDRLQRLTATGRAFTAPPGFDPATYFTHAFGITRPTDGEMPQEILLSFAPVQGRYAKGYPLHASQTVVLETNQEIRLRLFVYDTHDLRMELLSYGPEVTVLAPAGLRAWLRGRHRAAAAVARN